MRAIAHRFNDAFNRRDGHELVALCDREIDFRPVPLDTSQRLYHGHDGLRRWVAEVSASAVRYQAEITLVRAVNPKRFILLSEILVRGRVLCPAAMTGLLTDTGLIAEADGYLSKPEELAYFGLLPEEDQIP